MDNTPIYILMCEKAVRIQKHTLSVGDYYYCMEEVTISTGEYVIAEHTWLPRQDQLQGMVKDLFSSQWFMNKKFYIFSIHDSKNEYYSMEQLWLAFVMKEKYNKTWDGNKWILQNQ